MNPKELWKRREADSVFRDTMKRLDQLGARSAAAERVNRSVNGRDATALIREAQKEARKVIAWKLQDNLKRGRKANDGDY